MISRFHSTYTYTDLNKSLIRSFRKEISTELAEVLKKMYHVKHVFLLENGKTAITVLLKAFANPGGVLTPAYNCIAVPQAIAQAGYTPMFVDSIKGSLNVSIDDFINSITAQVTVLMPVHLFGIPWGMEEFLQKWSNREALLVEDVAPAFGARLNGKLAGQFSDACIISFHWTKPLSGETGGALLTNDDQLASNIQRVLNDAHSPNDRALMFIRTWIRKIFTERSVYPVTRRVHSLLKGEEMYEIVPVENQGKHTHFSLMSPFACALVMEQLGQFDRNLSRRNAIVEIYQSNLEALKNVVLPSLPENSLPSWIQYPVLVNNKLGLYKHMQHNGVDVTWSYRYSCPETYSDQFFPNSLNIAKSIIGLPTYPTLTDQEADKIGKIAREYISRKVS